MTDLELELNADLDQRINSCAARLSAIKAKLASPAIARSPLAKTLADNAAYFDRRLGDLEALRGKPFGIIAAGLASL